jgi:hypothetical protein
VAEPNLLHSLIDRLAIAFRGGARIRVIRSGGALAAFAVGDASLRPNPERIRRLVIELGPPGPGTVHIVRRERRLRVACAGALREAGFDQRLRNALAAL